MKTIIAVLLFVLAAGVFFPSVRHEFIVYDDPGYFSENPRVLRGLNWSNVAWAFTSRELSSWYPLTWLSFMLDATLFGPGPAGPHLTNVLLHAVNAVLLFFLLARMTRSRWRSAVVAALFAIHPLRVETVAWVAERKSVLCVFFGLLGLLAYARWTEHQRMSRAVAYAEGDPAVSSEKRRGTAFYWLAFSLFVCGLLSKPVLVTLPGLMLLLDYWPLARGSRVPFVRLVVEKTPFLIAGAILAARTVQVHHETDALSGLAAAPLTDRAANAFISIARYLGKTCWPTSLAMPYPRPVGWPAGWTVLAVALVAVLSFVAWKLGRRRPYVPVGWLWFIVSLAPVLGMVQWGTHSMADRFTYISLIGLFVIIVWAFAEMSERWRVPAWVRATLVILVLGACAGRTADQLQHWRDSESLFRHTLRVTKDNFVAHDEMGEALARQGRHAEAAAEFSAALRLNANYAPSLSHLSKILFAEGKFEAAEELLRRLVATRPDSALTHSHLAMVLARQGRTKEALPHHQEAIRLAPDRPEVLNNFAWLLATHPGDEWRDGVRAVALAERACELTGQTNFWFLSTLAAAHAERRNFGAAVQLQERVCELATAQIDRRQVAVFRERLELYRSGRAYRAP